jgi:flagellin
MTSIVTNAGAITAASKLRRIDQAQSKQMDEMATGYRVGNAKDNTAYWSIATTMRSDNKALAAAEDSLGLGAAAVDIAFAGIASAIDIVQEIKKKLITVREAGVDKSKINSELKELRQEIYTIVDGSSFNGENWLDRRSAADDKDREMVGSFLRDQNGTVSVKTLTYSMSNANGTNHLVDEDSQVGILTNAQYAANLGTTTDWVLLNGRNQTAHTEFQLDANTSTTDIDEMVSVTEAMLLAMTDTAADLGSLSFRIGMQSDFVSDLQDTQDRGVGRLVDAELDNSAVRLKAVETQSKIASQMISIANSSPLSILQLLN